MIEKEYQYTKNGYRSYTRYTNRFERIFMDKSKDVMFPKLSKHLRDVDETYFEHMGNALYYTLTFALLTVTTLIHSVLPFLFVETASRKIREINKHIHSRLTQDATIKLNIKDDE